MIAVCIRAYMIKREGQLAEIAKNFFDFVVFVMKKNGICVSNEAEEGFIGGFRFFSAKPAHCFSESARAWSG